MASTSQLSDADKKSDLEDVIQAALAAIHARGLKPDGNPFYSFRQAAKDFNIADHYQALTHRFHGRKTRHTVSKSRQCLSESQENCLVSWTKEMGRRGLPMTLGLVLEYASQIFGKKLGETWLDLFLKRNPSLGVRVASGLEACRAQGVNRVVVQEFYNILEELIAVHQIPPENIYNMDEKGIQLGIGKKVKVLVDRNQNTVKHIEDGNRELVTVLETVSANGTSLPPSFIFKGVQRDLEWGRNNPLMGSIMHSEKGWTDSELGTLWIKGSFEPQSAARNTTRKARLLILDGHNSHCTYSFCSFAEKYNILILCLPPHTTAVLQPCDVSVFGPLASAWGSVVLKASLGLEAITKHNLIQYYKTARDAVLTPSVIESAFRKTGIWPVHRNALPDEAYGPSLVTTTQSAQPLSASEPPLLVPTPASAILRLASSQSDKQLIPHGYKPHTIEYPAEPPKNATRGDLQRCVAAWEAYHEKAEQEIKGNYAQMKLMDIENGRIRKQLHEKEKRRTQKKRLVTGRPRHLTSEDNLIELGRADVKDSMKLVFREAAPIFRARRREIERLVRDAKKACKAREKAASRTKTAKSSKSAKNQCTNDTPVAQH